MDEKVYSKLFSHHNNPEFHILPFKFDLSILRNHHNDSQSKQHNSVAVCYFPKWVVDANNSKFCLRMNPSEIDRFSLGTIFWSYLYFNVDAIEYE